MPTTAYQTRSVNLLERAVARPGRVDPERGLIQGVKILGQKSQNGRDYSPQAMREAVPKYEGVRVYLEHPEPGNAGKSRMIREMVGVLEGVEFRAGALYGNLRLRKHSEHYNAILEMAKYFPSEFGLSHNATGKMSTKNGKQVVERIETVRSVDLVSTPATTAGLFESHQRPRRPVPLILQKHLPAVPGFRQTPKDRLRGNRHIPLKFASRH